MSTKAKVPDIEACRHMRSACPSFNLRKAERIMTDFYNAALEGSGITAVQLPLLASLRCLSQASLARLASEMDLDPSTLSRNLAILEKRGLIELRPGEDRRVREARLTRAGSKALADAHVRWQAATKELEKRLGDRSMTRALDTLRQLVRPVARQGAASGGGAPAHP